MFTGGTFIRGAITEIAFKFSLGVILGAVNSTEFGGTNPSTLIFGFISGISGFKGLILTPNSTVS